MDQENLLHASMLEKQSQEIQGNIQLVEREILELEQFSTDLDFISKSKEKEIISSMGKGIHLKAKLENNSLFVEVGAKIIVKKTPEETKKIIELQVKALKEARINLFSQLEISNANLSNLILEIQREQKVKQ